VTLSAERIAELDEAEEILLTVSDGGFGKRSSAYEYRTSGRGGQGIANMVLSQRTGTAVVATLPVRRGDDVMLVTDGGRLIRVPADQVRITARQAMGVTLYRTSDGEKITSIFPVLEEDTDADAETETDPAPPQGEAAPE
jgi:DNA gyrase subunit A